MFERNRILVVLLVVSFFSAAAAFPQDTPESLKERIGEFKKEVQLKRQQGCDVQEAIELSQKARKAFQEGDRAAASQYLEQAFEALEKASPAAGKKAVAPVKVNDRQSVDPSTLSIPKAQTVYKGTAVRHRITDEVLDYINTRFDFVMTVLNDPRIPERITRPKVFLYRNIQCTWEKSNHWDFARDIAPHENMFAHNTDPRNTYHNQRIENTVFDHGWLMDATDVVEAGRGDALAHWGNFFAVTAAKHVNSHDYDGLFIDMATNSVTGLFFKNNELGFPKGMFPDDYSREAWKKGRTASLKLVKAHLPDKLVIINGLHHRDEEESHLEIVDGGMWETFIVNQSTGRYRGKEIWLESLKLTQRHGKNKLIALVGKGRGLINNIQLRMFIMSSYLLVSQPNAIICLEDMEHHHKKTPQYYPEFDIRLGKPLGKFEMDREVYTRRFEQGLVLVNPWKDRELSYSLEEEYLMILPGGDVLVENIDKWNGRLLYIPVKGAIPVPAQSGVVLFKSVSPGAAAGPDAKK